MSSRTPRLSSIRSASLPNGDGPSVSPPPPGAAARWPPPGVPASRRRDEAAEDTVLPMPQYPSMYEATVVAWSRSPETPDELSLSKYVRLPGQRGERDEDVRLVLAAPPGELVLRLDRRHHAQVVAALLDRGYVDLHVMPRPVSDYRVARLVDRDRVPLPLDILHVLGRTEFLELLGLDHVLIGDDVTPVPDRDDQRLIDQVLDAGARRVRGDRGELVDLLVGELVRDLGEVPLVGANPARLVGNRPGRSGRCGPAAATPRPAPTACSSPSSPGCGSAAAAWAACRAPA